MESQQSNGGTEVIAVADAARRLGISTWTYYKRARLGQVPSMRLGRRVYVPVAQLERLIGQ